VIHVARSFGNRRARKASRLAVLAIETYNQRIFGDLQPPEERTRAMAKDFRRLNRAWSSLLQRDSKLVARVLDRVFESPHDLGDDSVPEAVMFLRGAVAAGVIAGDVPDTVHALLDRHVTWLGLAWEASRSTLDPRGWAGALRTIGVEDVALPADPASFAREQAAQALEQLPDGRASELFEEIVARLDRQGPVERVTAAWEPLKAPAPSPTHARQSAEHSELGAFRALWTEEIETALSDLVATRSCALRDATAYLSGQGGKRLRPLLVLAAAQACGGELRRALPAAATVEWLHQGSLVLDDIIDEATLRRGGSTLHLATSVPFATGVAVFVFARIHSALRGMHPGLRERLIDAASALVEGEQLELRHTGDLSLSLTGYYRIIEAKTARLFGCAAAAGGLSVEAPRPQVRALSKFGREAGLAFQIIDDLLDYVGREDQLGKSPGTDLRAAKVTLPVLLLRKELEAPDRERLDEILQGDEGPEHLDWVLELMERHQVEQACRERARDHLSEARKALDELPDAAGRQLLDGLATRLVERLQ